MVDTPLLAARNLTRYHHGRKVLHGIDLELTRGEVLGFLGPNGAGKSTTMNILCGVIAPHAGTVQICGFDIARQAQAAKRHLGYLPEVPPLHRDATVDEYLMFCARLRGLDGGAARTALARAKVDCDLNEVGSRLIANLSKGFQQRVGIAQALLHEPAVIVLDEPTSGLDPNQIRTVRDTIERLAERHAIILSTHILSEAQMLCHRVAILHDGRIAFNEALGEDQRTLVLALATPPPLATIRSLASICACHELAYGRYRLEVDDFDQAAATLSSAAVTAGWGLRELSRDTSALEQVFVELTCKDGTLET